MTPEYESGSEEDQAEIEVKDVDAHHIQLLIVFEVNWVHAFGLIHLISIRLCR